MRDVNDSAAASPSDTIDIRMPERCHLLDAMRRLIKFLHTMGAIKFIGSIASLLVLARLAPPPRSLSGYALKGISYERCPLG
jgi:hypothetical protein